MGKHNLQLYNNGQNKDIIFFFCVWNRNIEENNSGPDQTLDKAQSRHGIQLLEYLGLKWNSILFYS